MTSQKMAANGHKRFPYYILTSVKFSNFLPVLLNRKRSMVHWSIGSVEEPTKSLQKLDLQKGAKYCAKKYGRRWLEEIPGLYSHNVKLCNFLAVSYHFLALLCEARSFVGWRLTSLS